MKTLRTLETLIVGAALATPALAAPPPPPPPQAPAAATAPGAPTAPTAPVAPKAPVAPAPASREQAGYLFGLTFGEQLHRLGVANDISPEDVVRGLNDGLHGMRSAPADQQQLQAFVRTAMTNASARNQSAAKEFLARNGREKGVHTTDSGLEYRVLEPGDSKSAPIDAADTVTVNYRGKLLDGTEFDSSFAHGAPATFPVRGVIKGWQEALVLMKPGAKWQLFVPPELAYGDAPRPGIPGGSLLIFDVEILSVKPAAPAQPAAPARSSNPNQPPSQRGSATSLDR